MRYLSFFALSTVLCAAAAAETSWSLDAATDRTVYRDGSDNEIYVQARLVAEGSAPAANPAPRNIAFVIDRSGSMAGESLDAALPAVAAAAASLSSGDFAAVIAFGSEVETIVESQPAPLGPDLRAKITALEPAGGAALYDALNQAAAQIRRQATPQTADEIVLITDGPPTKGPREAADFQKLAQAFAAEGIVVSIVGLGAEFEEDTLAALARHAHGDFRYAPRPDQLAPIIAALVASRGAIIGHDAVLSFEFARAAQTVRAHGSRPATITGRMVSFPFPRLHADESFAFLASGDLEASAARVFLPDAVTVRLRWRQTDGVTRELVRKLSLDFSPDPAMLRRAVAPEVARTSVRILIGEGLQDAIEHLDAGDVRRAMRALRATRTAARDLTFMLDDSVINESIARFDAFLSEIQSRGLQPSDRKLLRSGLLGQFEPPHPESGATP